MVDAHHDTTTSNTTAVTMNDLNRDSADSVPTCTSSPTPAPAPSKRAPLLDCNLCELSFGTPEERRQHAKSEWHVYKLRCKVAQPGTTVTPPASPSPKAPSKPRHASSDEESHDDASVSEEDEDDIEFTPEECLFCNHLSPSLDANLTHMAQTHSLTIPHPSSLIVDTQTILWFLHMVIYQYRECICCGRRKKSVEAVQAHMISTGHCRFDITEEMESFYDMENPRGAERGERPDERTLRLPSGKILGHRSYSEHTLRRPRTASPNTSSLPSSSTSIAMTTNKDRRDESLAVQLSGMRKGDQMSLVHLSAPEQRALLARHKKETDKAKRAERRKRSKLDRVGDKVAVHVNYYKQEVPIYQGG